MGRGRRNGSSESRDSEAIEVMASFLGGASPLKPLERSFDAADAVAHLGESIGPLALRERGRWLYLVGPRERDYQIVGKYLFFAPVPEQLLPAAERALLERGFHHAKLSRYRSGYPMHVLCVYFKDDSRLEEMRALAAELGLDFGGWKTDAQTRSERESG